VSKGPKETTQVRKRFAKKRSRSEATNPDKERELFRPGTPQDVSSPRAKNSRHRKVTADKWNQ
jgi:hypothetical protein